MAKKRLTGHEREIHKQAVAIRKRIAAMPDDQLIELERQALAAKLTEERASVEQSEAAINKVADFLNNLENGAIPGIGVGKIQRMRELAFEKDYI